MTEEITDSKESKKVKANMQDENNIETILGVKVSNETYDTLSKKCLTHIEKKEQAFIVAINPEKIMLASNDEKLQQLLNQADYQIPDGIGVILASKLQKGTINERITGVDLMERLIEDAASHKKKVFFYGGKPGVAESAKKALEEEYAGLSVVGVLDGYQKDEQKVIDTINQQAPDYLFVALGSPKQEQWIVKHKKHLNVSIFQGVGGSFDVFSGNVKRAPAFFRKTGTEWLYRLLKEPKRIKRQLNLPRFLVKVMKNLKRSN